jgi:hypothetical protein
MVARTALCASISFVLVAWLLGGCGGAKPPTAQVGRSEAAIRGAVEVGAPKVPEAALHLKMARDNLAAAQKLMANEDYDEAALLLQRAEADADVAIALSKEAQAQEQADAAHDKIKRLKQELE